MTLHDNLRCVQDQIEQAAERSGRVSGAVTLVAVTKTQSADIVENAFELGLRHFGESRVQELIKKKDLLSTQIHWHQIGYLQSNKAKYIAPFVHLVHSIDSLETAIELSKRAEQNARVIDVLLEVNIAAEPQKNGIAPEKTALLLESILEQATALKIKGLMTVAPFEANPEHTRPYFRSLRKLHDRLQHDHPDIRELSMGMSNDFEIAIEEGATIIRIGSALFGERI